MHTKFIPKTAIALGALLLTAGGVASTAIPVNAANGSFAKLGKKQAADWSKKPDALKPGNKKMNQGYLVFHSRKSKSYPLKATPFGNVPFFNVTQHNGNKNDEYYGWKIPLNQLTTASYAGSFGVFYKNAASFRDYKTMQAVQLDAAVFVVGWQQDPSSSTGHLEKRIKNQIWFSKKAMSMQAQGRGSITIAIQFYAHDSGKGYTKGQAFFPHASWVLKDLDYGQYFGIHNLIKGAGSKDDRVFYGPERPKPKVSGGKKGTYQDRTFTSYDLTAKNHETTFSGDPRIPSDPFVPENPKSKDGSIKSEDPRGWLEFYDKWSQGSRWTKGGHPITITFNHNILSGPHKTSDAGALNLSPTMHFPSDAMQRYEKNVTSKLVKKVTGTVVANNPDTGRGIGSNYFGIAATPGRVIDYHADKGKLLSNQKNSKSDAKGGPQHWMGNYYRTLAIADKEEFAYDVYEAVSYPASTSDKPTNKDTYKAIGNFDLSDTVDPQLTVGQPFVVQTASNAQYYASKQGSHKRGDPIVNSQGQHEANLSHAISASKYFEPPTVKKTKDGTVVTAKLKFKPKANDTTFFNHVYPCPQLISSKLYQTY